MNVHKAAAGVLMALSVSAQPGLGAEYSSAKDLVMAVRAQRVQQGFEARLQAVTTDSMGHRSVPVRFSVIGQFEADRLRLVFRAIAPSEVRDRTLAAELASDGSIIAVERLPANPPAAKAADPFGTLFGSELVIWDLLAPWWYWPAQAVEGSATFSGQKCQVVRSRPRAARAPIAEAISCVRPDALLSLSTELLNSRGEVVRTILLIQTARRESGALTPRRFTVIAAKGSVTQVEVYSADEHHPIDATTFAMLDSSVTRGR